MSNPIILTAEDGYRRFISGIRKASTRTVTPQVFNVYFNDACLDWQQSKLPLVEFNQKRIDDLELFRVVTDGTVYPYILTTSFPNTFPVPNNSPIITGQLMVSNTSSALLPLYRHGLNATFLDGDDVEFMADIMRSDQRGVTIWNPYRKATTNRPYYELVGGFIRLSGRIAVKMRLEYIRYPKLVTYDETTPLDPETNPTQNKEITDIAIRMFLENRGDPRYKSTLQEMMIRSQSS